MKGREKAKFFVIGTIAIGAVVFLCTGVAASTKSEIKKGELMHNVLLDNGKYVSPVLHADFKNNLVGFAWQGGSLDSFSLRFHNSKGWSNWYSPETKGHQEKDGWKYLTDPIVTDQSDQFQYRLAGQEISESKLVYLNSRTQKLSGKINFFSMLFNKARAAGGVEIIPRTGWEADESLRLNANNQVIWPTQYEEPKKFVIHHTAGSDGGSNPAATIRGIYYWHSQVLGWGDIGYNYLIDQNGNIYEGRYGGDGAIGAHAYRSATCNQSRFGQSGGLDFNRGTIGISVLGDYENNLTLNNAAKEAMTDLISQKGKEFGIEPVGQSNFVDNIYPNIIGHKDVDCTACPGVNMYSQLGTIRSLAQEKYGLLGGAENTVIKATYISQSETDLSISLGEERDMWVDYKNEGNVTWHAFQNEFYIVPITDPSVFYSPDFWESETKMASLTTTSVAPGETGRFVFKIKGPQNLVSASEYFQLAYNDEVLSQTGFKINAEITGLSYAAEIENAELNQAMFINDKQTVKLTFRNKGTESWLKGKVKLNISDLGERPSNFYENLWPEKSGGFDFAETEVKTNSLATFNFRLKSPAEPGLYKNIFSLEGENDITQNENFMTTRVDSMYKARMVSNTVPLAMLNYWRVPAVVRYKNTGVATWKKNMVLKIYDLDLALSKFKDSSWNSEEGDFVMTENEVKSGQIGTFQLKLKAPKKLGLYLQIFKLSIKNSEIPVQNSETQIITRVDS